MLSLQSMTPTEYMSDGDQCFIPRFKAIRMLRNHECKLTRGKYLSLEFLSRKVKYFDFRIKRWQPGEMRWETKPSVPIQPI